MLKLEQLSYWEKKTYFEELDFLVIGAGIVGSSTALHLRQQYPAAKILVVERNFLPAGASTKNAGFACFGSVTELIDDLSKMSENDVWETVAERWEGLKYLRELIGDANLDFQGFGSWDLIRNDENSTLEKCLEKLPYLNQRIATITGVQNVYSLDNNVKEKFGFNAIQSAFHNKLEGQIDTGKMMVRFHQLLSEQGIYLLTGIDVLELSSTEKQVEIQSNIGPFCASKVAICVNGFAQRFLPKNDTLPARAQVIITKKIDNLPFKGTFHYQDGYYYFRNINDRVLFGGGRNLDFQGETTTEIDNSDVILNQLEKLLKEIILPKTPFEIDYAWAGIMGVGKSKKPIIELVKPNIAVGVRMGGMGVAIGTIVGRNVAKLL
jgi:glycine/D-amino acid oxidase-like deaminating enzyme